MGNSSNKKNLPMLMAMHDIPYVATATLSHLDDFGKKLVKAREKAKEGLAYIHVFCPCLVGWKMPMDSSIEVCRSAFKTNYFPLWEAEDGEFRFTKKVANPKPITEFTSLIGKFKHLSGTELAIMQKNLDKRYRTLKTLCDSFNEAAAGE